MKIVINTVSKRQQVQWKVKAYTAISFKTHLGRFSKQKKSYQSCIPLVFVNKFKISIKWFLSGEFRWSLCKLKHQNMKKVLHKIYWNLSNLTEDAAGETLRVCKTTVVGNEELRRFPETPKLILTFIQTIDIGLKQRLMKKLKQNAYYNKINILSEKAQMIIYAFLNHFSVIRVQTRHKVERPYSKEPNI